MTTSPVELTYTATPVLQDVQGRTYCVQGDAGAAALPNFASHGMQRTQGAADVTVRIQLGMVDQGQPGALKIGGGYVPAFTVAVPYQVTFLLGDQVVDTQQAKYDNVLTFQGAPKFAKREEAIAAIDTIRKLAEKGIVKRAREEAVKEAHETANAAASNLFVPREITVAVPVVRMAAGLDFESAFTMLTENGDAQQALETYERAGTQQMKPDGTPNNTANYGVACGIAAARLLLGDASGAWEATKLADTFEPAGEEADQIRLLVYRQEQHTGIAVIPQEERSKIQQAEQAAGVLQKLFAQPSR